MTGSVSVEAVIAARAFGTSPLMAFQSACAISVKPEIGLAAGGSGGGAAAEAGAAGAAGEGATGAAGDGAGAGFAAAGAGCAAAEAVPRAASCAFSAAANWFISADAVAWIMPTPRPYCATAPDSVRSVCTSTLEPAGEGSSRNVAAACAEPRPLASVPCARTRAVWFVLSISSNFTVPANVSATGPSRTAMLPL